MIILALDVATNTGFCSGELARHGKVLWADSGEVNFKMKRGEGRGMRFVRFRKWFTEMLDNIGPDIVVYEQAHMRGGPATEALVGLTTIVIEMCDMMGMDYTTVHTGQLKKHATSKGNASKAEMILAANRLSFVTKKIKGDDEADAVHIFDWARDQYGPGSAGK